MLSTYQPLIEETTTVTPRTAGYLRRIFDMAAEDEQLDSSLRKAAQIALEYFGEDCTASYGELFLVNEIKGRYTDDNVAAMECTEKLSSMRMAA